jgi:hypothetical protein
MNVFDKAEQMMERMEFHTQALQSEPLPAVCEEMCRTSDFTDRKSWLREMVGRYLDLDLDPSTAVTLAWFEAFGVTPGAITIATTPAFKKVDDVSEGSAPHWAAWSPTSGCGEDIMKVLEAAAAFIELIENDAGGEDEIAETAMRQCGILADG